MTTAVIIGGVKCASEHCAWHARVAQENLNEPPAGTSGPIVSRPQTITTSTGTLTLQSGAGTIVRIL